eukprot:TRINITY_DN4524_c0_g1_i1.p1 TRINITY_DN4524_c0_g1~~TRINITY_DN4524_c0_g1_i1.p1  ORF type:complete len:676 (+),score=148.71 TRINITY_DN4524_c0_g1_i1:176-2203(+)
MKSTYGAVVTLCWILILPIHGVEIVAFDVGPDAAIQTKAKTSIMRRNVDPDLEPVKTSEDAARALENGETVVVTPKGKISETQAEAKAAELPTTHGEPVHSAAAPASAGSKAAVKSAGKATVKSAGTATVKSQTTAGVATGAAKGNTSASTMLFGMMVYIMALVYLTNWPDPDIKHATWKTISNTLSILCALLIFHAIRDLTNILVKDETQAVYHAALSEDTFAGLGAPGHGAVTRSFVLFVICFVLLEILLVWARKNPFRLASSGIVGGQLVAFMAADAFATAQESEPWNKTPSMSFAMVVIAMVSTVIMAVIAASARQGVVNLDSAVDEQQDEAWIQQCAHSEDMLISFAAGLTLTQYIRFKQMGYIPHFHGIQKNGNLSNISTLFGVGMGFGILACVFDLLTPKLNQLGPAASRFGSMSMSVFGMTMSWCLLFSGKWYFNRIQDTEGIVGAEDLLVAQLMMAMMFGGFGFAGILVFDKLADKLSWLSKGFRVLNESIILLIGLSWESVFIMAIKQRAASLKAKDQDAQAVKAAELGLVLCFMILPAWAMYIMPRALEGEGKHIDGDSQEAPKPAVAGRVAAARAAPRAAAGAAATTAAAGAGGAAATTVAANGDSAPTSPASPASPSSPTSPTAKSGAAGSSRAANLSRARATTTARASAQQAAQDEPDEEF